jgi:hypothetical protein
MTSCLMPFSSAVINTRIGSQENVDKIFLWPRSAAVDERRWFGWDSRGKHALTSTRTMRNQRLDNR